MDVLDRIVSITELRRNFGALTDDLPAIDGLILTKNGEPYAVLKAVPAEKRKILRRAAGAWKNTALGSGALWREVSRRRSRRAAVQL